MIQALISALFLTTLIASAQAAPHEWPAGFQGDPRTVGRGGAGDVLADSFWGALQNPAGSALVAPVLNIEGAANSIHDSTAGTGSSNYSWVSGGLIVPGNGWGLAAGEALLRHESGSLDEASFSASRLFMNDRLSLGAGLNWGQELGGSLGALYRFDHRFFVGGSFHSALEYKTLTGDTFIHPWQLGLAVGQIPNRFFSFEAGLRLIGPSIPGGDLRLQPHVGLEYQLVSLRNIGVRGFGGTYFDGARLHGTLGFGITPWIFSLALATDVAAHYQNYLVTFGLDIGKLAKKLKLIPPVVSAPPAGFFPKPLEISDDWLPPRLQDDPEHALRTEGLTPQQIKEHLEEHLKSYPQQLKDRPLELLEEEKKSLSDDLDDVVEQLNNLRN